MFAFWRFLSDISATRGRIHTEFYLCRNNVCRRGHSPPVGSIGLWGAEGGELKSQKMGGWSHSCIGQLPFLPRDAMQARSLLSCSVCPSVRPSVTFRDVRGSRQNE